MANLHVTNDLTVDGQYTNILSGSDYSDSLVYWYACKIPLETGFLVLHFGEGRISKQNGSIEWGFQYPYGNLTFGIGVCGNYQSGRSTNGIYWDNTSTSTIKFALNASAMWFSFVIAGYNAS